VSTTITSDRRVRLRQAPDSDSAAKHEIPARGGVSVRRWDRTSDLGIKSLARTIAASGRELKLPANSRNRDCARLHRAAGGGDSPVLPAVLQSRYPRHGVFGFRPKCWHRKQEGRIR